MTTRVDETARLEIRPLVIGEERTAEEFLRARADTTMILRSNPLRAPAGGSRAPECLSSLTARSPGEDEMDLE